MKFLNIKDLFKISMAATLLFSGYMLVAQAQTATSTTSTTLTITYPIKELGNCGSKQECKAYCDQAENIQACVSFAQSHGLMSDDEAGKATKFGKALRQGGPGGCSTAEACKTYCKSASHSTECLSFAQNHGLITAEQVQVIKKALPLFQNGQTPGGCTDKGSCESYCKNKDHRQECLDFAVRLGIVTKTDAQKIAETNGTGPGGCTDKESCQVFCDKSENQQTCLDFAKEHGLISDSETKDIKQGMSNVKIGLNQAPVEVRQCLKDKLGEDVVTQIENGQLTPNSDAAGQIVKCYQQNKTKMKQGMIEKLKNNPQVQTCIQQSIGADVLTQLKNGQPPSDPTVAEKIKFCFEQNKPNGDGNDEHGTSTRSGIMPGEELGQQLKACVAAKLELNASSTPPSPESAEVQTAVKACQQQLGIPSSQKPIMMPRRDSSEGSSTSGQLPPPPRPGDGQGIQD